ncbi:MAG: hypothetical protein KBB91_00595 [Candidatus Pacebacteria bacterium]|jgi:hypothetical protein|nr:hypothetical protein [Candidatus Paceibacterota bacterium]MBP9700830.1 hypothetical protein [Candidatus Paceibacterota bacterium]
MQTNKIFIFIVFIALVGFAFYSNKSTPTTVTPIEQLPPITGEEPVDQTFTGSTFTFRYPKDMTVTIDDSRSWRVNTVPESGQQLAKVSIDTSTQPNTNFMSAWFNVGSSTSVQEIKNCLVATNGEEAKGSATINGVEYKKFLLGDAGMSQYYETTSYRALRDTQCYAIEYTIHSSSLAAYDSSQGITAFDKAAITAVLESMVQSFKFL